MRPSVAVLLLNWNNYPDAAKCLESLRDLEYSDFHVIVLDNGSTDDSLSRIEETFPDIEVMKLGANFGFAKGNNVGIRSALQRGAEYIWLLNTDTVVIPGSLTAMVELAEKDEKIGAVGSAIYSMLEREKLRAWGGGYIDFLFGRALQFETFVNNERIEFLTGASLLLRREALESVGLLDENFFMYWEDADYCYRLRRAGWKLAVAADSKVWHKEQGSIGKKSLALDVYFNRSAVHFFKKHASSPLIPILGSLPRRMVRWALKGDWGRVRKVWQASGVAGNSRRVSE